MTATNTTTDKAIVLGHILDNLEELDKLHKEQQEAILGISLAVNRYQQFITKELERLQND